MQCPRCQHENPAGQKFCGDCGTPLNGASPTAGSYEDLRTELERLRRALSEAVEQQTATSDILRIISRSPIDIQPVLDSVAESAARLCEAQDATVFRRDGNRLLVVAHHGPIEFGPVGEYSLPLVRGTANGRSVLEGQVVHLADLQAEVEEFPEGSEVARRFGHRSVLNVPLMRDGVAIGSISLRRTEVRLFTERQVALLQTFAEQAVIAIENVRLFKELEARNTELRVALEQQTATNEILGVISNSPNDLEPVFNTILANAARLCHAHRGALLLFRDGAFETAAELGAPAALAEARKIPYRPEPDSYSLLSRVAFERRALYKADLVADRAYQERDPRAVAAVELGGSRSMLAVPLLKEEVLLGAITIHRPEPGPFSDEHISLLQTFADQAVIAIENVRLFKELEARNRDLTETLEQQTATSEILRVVSSSPTDIRPVFDTIVSSAVRLCGAHIGAVYQFDGELIHLVSHYNFTAEGLEAVQRALPRPPRRDLVSGRAILQRAVVQIEDVLADPEYHSDIALKSGWRGMLAVPMLREGSPIGTIVINRNEPGPFADTHIELLKTFADQAVIAIENVRLFKELEARNRDLTEALDQQTATAEILRVISSSPTDVQPVFDTIARSAAKLCDALGGNVQRFDGELMHLVASHNWAPEGLELARRRLPIRPTRSRGAGRAVLSRAVVHIPDVLEDPEYSPDAALAGGWRTILSVPMLREGNPVGAITVTRAEPGPFSDNQIRLLQTFADQAVIAIENVRLFNETKEALEQQTATSEILRVISSSPTDVQPVFDAIAESARRLCEAASGGVVTLDGEWIHVAAVASASPEGADLLRNAYPRPLNDETATARAVRTCSPVVIPDVAEEPEYSMRGPALAGGFRSVLAVPMVREGSPIGAIGVGRPEPGPFSDKQLALLQIFADQAVIAIENVRLFNETKEALEQQTATADILRVISSSPTDLQPVFDAIAKSAAQLCEASFAGIARFDGEMLTIAALHNVTDEQRELLERLFPSAVDPKFIIGRAVLERRIVHIDDVAAPGIPRMPGAQEALGYRTFLAVPMLRKESPIGVITIWRTEVRPFSPKQIALVQTFADQAVIAIENVRLFKELEAKTAELTRSVGEMKALGEVGRAVSSTLDLQTVLDTIVTRAAQLSGTRGGVIYEYDEATDKFHLRAAHQLEDELVEALRLEPLRLGEGATGQAAATRAPFQVTNLADEKEYALTRIRSILARLGYRSILAVPLIFEERTLGALVVHRPETGAFAPEVVNLLQTFATQSALAIQNARLFREIEDKSRQLEAASRHKSEFLANMSHELRTPLNAITGFSEVLLERMFGEINPKQTEYLQDILSSGRHLLSLINDILDLSKIEAGRMELTLAPFHLPLALENALTLVKERAARHGIALDIDVDPRLGEFVGDERKIKQVLLNLLSNAVKFTPEGGRIGVKAFLVDGAVEIAVSDTGIGIAPKDQEAIFEEFRQVGSDEARKVEGTGLGLTLTKKFVEMHGGRIWVESDVGKGSTFRFTLPVRPWPTSSS